MITAKYKWQIAELSTNPKIKTIATELKITPTLSAILWERGLQNADEMDAFLHPSPANLRDPFLMHDMQKGIDRIAQAIGDDEKITIYGDYDADGITSTAILYETLLEIGANVNYYLPNRFKDGYGPNEAAFRKIIDDGTTLIITVDNGIVGNDAIAVANQMACDVIVSDHHNLPPQLPDAYAIIHARFPDHEYPFGDFSGAGVAFKIATALMDEIPQDLLDLAAIGTVADLVSLTDENRVIVKYGFKAIELTQRPGLAILLKNAGLTGKTISSHQIGFQIAPRLNALGRMGDANSGVELLTTLDPERAQQLASQMEDKNKKRQQLVSDITKQAVQQANDAEHKNCHILVIAGDDWHEGVLGIVASRLVDRFHKPTLVLTSCSDRPDTFKGSGRSIAGFDLFASLDGFREQMAKFGGHEMAVGLTIAEDHLQALGQHLESYYQQHLPTNVMQPLLSITSRLDMNQINLNLYQDIQKMAPFGTDNPEPEFLIEPDTISNVMVMGKNNQHLKMVIHGDENSFPAVAFRRGTLRDELMGLNSQLLLAGKLDLNEWNGNTNLQFIVDDLASNGISMIDERCTQLNQQMFAKDDNYVFFNKKIYQQVEPFIAGSSKMFLANEITAPLTMKELVIVDLPERIDDLTQLLGLISVEQIKFYCYHRNDRLIIPKRAQFARAFQWLAHHPDIDVKKAIKDLMRELKLSSGLVIFIIKVFQELQFVRIQNNIVRLATTHSKHQLRSAPVYQARLQRIDVAEQLLGSQQRLFSFIQNHLKNKDKEGS